MDRAEGNPGRPVIWFEVEDIFRHFDWISQPGGIYRVCFEIFAAARRLPDHDVRFCRISSFNGRIYPIEFGSVLAEFERPGTEISQSRGGLRWLKADAIFIGRILRFFARRAASAIGDALKAEQMPAFAPGDILVSAGLTLDQGYVARIAELKREHGLRFALLLHDMVPITHPQFVPRRFAELFATWLEAILPLADVVFSASDYGKAQLVEWCKRNGRIPPSVRVIRFGDGFTPANGSAGSVAKLRKPYVLYVSTIHIRKNHGLLLRVWERMIARHGAGSVPDLVWVGDRGWLTTDVFRELRGKKYLDGKVIVISEASDASLREIYANCEFTVYPSLAEGWGLPIAESLSFGKPCVASNRTSLPEVAGSLVDYFDPGDEEAALAAIERVILSPRYLAQRTSDIRTYQPRLWDDCAREMFSRA